MQAACRAEELTAGNRGLILSIAVGYGGRSDVARAAAEIAQLVHDGALAPSQVMHTLSCNASATPYSPTACTRTKMTGARPCVQAFCRCMFIIALGKVEKCTPAYSPHYAAFCMGSFIQQAIGWHLAAFQHKAGSIKLFC